MRLCFLDWTILLSSYDFVVSFGRWWTCSKLMCRFTYFLILKLEIVICKYVLTSSCAALPILYAWTDELLIVAIWWNSIVPCSGKLLLRPVGADFTLYYSTRIGKLEWSLADGSSSQKWLCCSRYWFMYYCSVGPVSLVPRVMLVCMWCRLLS